MKNSWIFIIGVIIPISIQASNYTGISIQKVPKGPKGHAGPNGLEGPGGSKVTTRSNDLYLAISSINFGHSCSNFLEPGLLN